MLLPSAALPVYSLLCVFSSLLSTVGQVYNQVSLTHSIMQVTTAKKGMKKNIKLTSDSKSKYEPCWELGGEIGWFMDRVI